MKFYKMNKETGSDLDIALCMIITYICIFFKQEVELNSIIIERKKIISIKLNYFLKKNSLYV